MKIILLRHGDRSGGYGDVELSAKGQQQALDLCQAPQLQDVQWIFSSPKIRAQQTVQPLAKHLNLPLKIEVELDQRKSIETEQEFIHRVLKFMSQTVQNQAHENVILCSHSDWLQMAVLNLFADHPKAAAFSFFGCSEFHTVQYKNQKWDIS